MDSDDGSFLELRISISVAMPTFTAIALDRLLEPGSGNPAPRPPPPPVRLGQAASDKKRTRLPHASPALYATPEATPLPDSPSSFPPSPYILNHKRRGPRLLKSHSQSDVGRPQLLPDAVIGDGGDVKVELEQKAADAPKCQGEEIVNRVHHKKIGDADSVVGVVGSEESAKPVAADQEKDGEDFFDLQDSMSTASNDSNGPERLWKPGTPLGEYFDALEEISSEGATRAASRNIEDELREMRLNVLMEIERRKQAEEAIENLQNQWQMLSYQLSLVGLILPAPPTIIEETDRQSNLDPAEELCRQVVIARFVAGSIARGCSRAEVELEMEPQIESKNFEIARLWDRLQYYEAANREMSQRNQEAVEMARQHRHRRKRRQKWLWSCIGLTITLGTAALAWSYLPQSKPTSSHEGDTAVSRES